MKPLTGIKWSGRKTYMRIEDEGGAALIRGWVKCIGAHSWLVDLRAVVCGIYITAYYETKQSALDAIPDLLRALPDEWQAAIGGIEA